MGGLRAPNSSTPAHEVLGFRPGGSAGQSRRDELVFLHARDAFGREVHGRHSSRPRQEPAEWSAWDPFAGRFGCSDLPGCSLQHHAQQAKHTACIDSAPRKRVRRAFGEPGSDPFWKANMAFLWPVGGPSLFEELAGDPIKGL